MPRPIPQSVPDDIAEMIRSNPKWGDLTGFAKQENIPISSVYSVFLYSKYEPLKLLERMSQSSEVSLDRMYEILAIPNTDKRKSAFRNLYQAAGYKTLAEYCDAARVAETTVRTYLDRAKPPRSLATYHRIVSRLGISLDEFATNCLHENSSSH